MSVSNVSSRVRENGNGSNTEFDFSFKIFAKTELLVYKVVIATGVATLQTVDVDYTVSINTITEGGTVTYTVAPTAAQASLIIRSIPYTQTAVLPIEGNFREDQVEAQLDRSAMRDIQLEEITDRSLKLPIESTYSNLTVPDPSSGKALKWKSDLTGLENTTYDPDTQVAAAAASAAAAAASAGAASASEIASAASATASATSAAAAAAAVGSIIDLWGGTSGGAANVQTLTPSPAISAYVAGVRLTFLAGFTNSGAATINVSGLGAKDLKTQTGAALSSGNITAGRIYSIIYDGTNFIVDQLATVEDSAITNAKIVAAAGIPDSKLAQITTAGKVSGAALTSFASIPSGAGEIPALNLAAIYPVGSIYINAAVSTNPATLFGFGTWAAYGAGRVIVGLDSGQTEFDTLDETGGAKTHTLSAAESGLPQHAHSIATCDGTAGGINPIVGNFANGAATHTIAAANAGGVQNVAAAAASSAHNNLQPYIVAYMWERTA